MYNVMMHITAVIIIFVNTVPPTLTDFPQSHLIYIDNAEDSLTFNCTAYSDPSPTVTFYGFVCLNNSIEKEGEAHTIHMYICSNTVLQLTQVPLMVYLRVPVFQRLAKEV